MCFIPKSLNHAHGSKHEIRIEKWCQSYDSAATKLKKKKKIGCNESSIMLVMILLWAACDDGCSTRVNEKPVAQRQLASQVSNGENFQNLTGNQTDTRLGL